MQRLIIVGAGGHGRSVAEAALASGAFTLVGFLDDAYPAQANVWGFPVLGTTADLPKFQGLAEAGVIALGNNELRERFYRQLQLANMEGVSVVHPKAIVAPTAVIGAGSTIMAGAIIGTEARLGEGVIVNCGTVVDHHCMVGAFCHLGVRVAMAGGSVLGQSSWMQAGAILGYGAIVGAGVTVAPGEVICGH